ncbi:MAG TPA: enediyne biosynthesis protein UnbU, partial [Candidatus Angelobacter sp.]|nr:enediyne biosynthesis protein UnbU [Candidatus Angelobacter sp.]
QAVIRSSVFGTPLMAALNPMTGVAFILFSFYMISDPATTPFSARGQVAFGAAVASAYGLLLVTHVVFGLFFALTTVSGVRAVTQYVWNFRKEGVAPPIPAPQPIAVLRKHA